MKFISDIQLKLAKFQLGRAAVLERNVQSINLKEAKTLGIVYCANNEESTDLVKRYVKFLREYKIKVKAIGYFEENELPLNVNSTLEFDYITQKDLNFGLQPRGIITSNFLEEEYDILIDVNVENNIVMQYLVHYSKAKFKVGADRLKYKNQFDLTIILKPEEGARQLMKNIDRYLHVIHA